MSKPDQATDRAAYFAWRQANPMALSEDAWHAAKRHERAEIAKLLPAYPATVEGVKATEAIRARCT